MEHDDIVSLKTHLLNAVFHKESKRVVSLLSEIQDTHMLWHGCRAFMLDGKPIWNGDAAAAKVKKKVPLDADLQDNARLLVAKINKITADKQRVINFFSILCQYCRVLQDFRDMLPDMVVERMFPHEITGIPRLREPGYAFVSLPTKLKLYQDGTDIMFHYLVNELVF